MTISGREGLVAQQVVERERLAPKRADARATGPSSASGGMIALTREPSGRRASTIGRGLVDPPADLARRSGR